MEWSFITTTLHDKREGGGGGGGGGILEHMKHVFGFVQVRKSLLRPKHLVNFEQFTTCSIRSRICPLVILAMVVLESEQFVSVK